MRAISEMFKMDRNWLIGEERAGKARRIEEFEINWSRPRPILPTLTQTAPSFFIKILLLISSQLGRGQYFTLQNLVPIAEYRVESTVFNGVSTAKQAAFQVASCRVSAQRTPQLFQVESRSFFSMKREASVGIEPNHSLL